MQTKKKDKKNKVLILFEGVHLAYSPTVLQIYEELKKEYDVTIFTVVPEGITKQKPFQQNVIYYKYDHSIKRYFYRVIFEILLLFKCTSAHHFNNKHEGYYFEYFFRYLRLKRLLNRNGYDRVISVDIKNLFFCTLLNQRSDFLSMELCTDIELLEKVKIALINCVLIQSKERKEYLFPGGNLKTFYVQNAPIYKHINIPVDRKGLIYAGTAWDAFGFYHCLNYINKYKNEILFVQGTIPPDDKEKTEKQYADIIKENRLIFSKKYLDNDEVVSFIAHFEIGFCFYNFNVSWVNTYNYLTAPSGKLFKYLAAGVPVVCNDIIGFQFVKERECGILIPDLEADTIDKAIQKIRNNYYLYSENALKVAEYYTFDKAIKPYLDYINFEKSN